MAFTTLRGRIRTLRRLIVSSSLMCTVAALSTSAYGQQNGCESIIKNGLYDFFRDSQDAHTAAQIRSEVARASQQMEHDQTSVGVGVQYGLFGGSVSVSASQLRAMNDAFSSSFDSANSQDSVINKTSQVLNAAAVDAWRACMTQVRDGLQVTFDVPDDPLVPVHFGVRYVAPMGQSQELNIRAVQITPAKAFTCRWTDSKKKDVSETSSFKVTSGNQVGFDCERSISKPAVTIGNRQFFAVPVRVTVQTDRGESTRPFSGLPAAPPMPTPSQVLMAAFPTGTILSWASTAPIPSGWAVCDGTRGTPNLKDRFVRGTGDRSQVGAQGGSDSHTHSFSIRTPDSGRKGSDFHWGETPWCNGPNPTMAGQVVAGETASATNVPTFTSLVFIMKL